MLKLNKPNHEEIKSFACNLSKISTTIRMLHVFMRKIMGQVKNILQQQDVLCLSKPGACAL